MSAIQYNKVEIIKMLIRTTDINASGSYYSSAPLHLAVINGQYDIIQFLLHKGANVDAQDTYGTPLYYSATYGDKRSAVLLLEAGANPNLNGRENESVPPLLGASEAGKSETLKLLVEHGANVDYRDAQGMTALMLAAREGHSGVCELLLSLGANPFAKSNDGTTVMSVAAQEYKQEVVELLLRHGVDIDEPNEDNDTLLTMAVKEDRPEMVNLLIRCGANVDRPNNDNDTPLMTAVKANNPYMVAVLLQHGADVEKPDEQTGETPLAYAAIEGYTEIIEVLLDGKADIEQLYHDSTALMLAAGYGRFDTVKLLVRHGAIINRQPDGSAHTALTCAAWGGHLPVVKYLLECRASAVPPPAWKKWKYFKFGDDVDITTANNIRELLREYKHRHSQHSWK
jgi:ankyrin repeat protein